MRKLLRSIDTALEAIGHGWTTNQQAHAMAASILAIRPMISVEIGVYAGKGLVSMALAHKTAGRGKVIGIDPYSQDASASGQLNPADKDFWQGLDHESIFNMATSNLERFGVKEFATIIRSKSCDAPTPTNIGVLRIDGNHGEVVLSDVAQYCPNVVPGGFLFLDDENWTGGAVLRAAGTLRQQGWKEIYRVDQTIVFQKP